MRARNWTYRRILSMPPINTRTNYHIITTRTMMSIFRLKFFGRYIPTGRYVLRVALTTFAALVCSVAPALAAPPEQPVTEPATGVTTTTATLHGVLNPAASAKVRWSFAYSPEQFGPECFDAFRTAEEEVEGEALPETVELTELEANRKYTACLTASNEEGETRGNEVTFQTPPAPPKVDGESVLVTPVGATLEAQINPNNEKTAYFFRYRQRRRPGREDAARVRAGRRRWRSARERSHGLCPSTGHDLLLPCGRRKRTEHDRRQTGRGYGQGIHDCGLSVHRSGDGNHHHGRHVQRYFDAAQLRRYDIRLRLQTTRQRP